jgi:hypothetical protein
VPVPYGCARAGVSLAQLVSHALFPAGGKLPSILVPCRFEARFKPLGHSNRKARALLGWHPRLSYQECLDRTYGAAPKPVSSALIPSMVTTP